MDANAVDTTERAAPVAGGGFLITNPAPGDVFTPEDLNEDQRLVGQTVRDFVQQDLLPSLDRIEEKEWAVTRTLLRRLGELGVLGIEVPGAYGGAELDKVTSLVVSEELSAGSFSVTYGAHVGIGMEHRADASHAYIRYDDVRVPADHLLGKEGSAFVIAQTRLGGGRIHHAMRTVAQLRKAFDMMCERALSRETQGEKLAEKQMVQERIADSWIEIEQFRLLVLRTAWLIDKYKDYKRTRKDIAAIKVAMPKVLHDVAQRAMHLHGALGVSDEMPFMGLLLAAEVMGIADGPTEVHKITIARQVLRDYKPADGLWPTEHLPTKRAAARERLAHLLEGEVGNL